MSKQKCSAKDPSNCRYHGTSTSKLDTAVATGDINAYINARENETNEVPDFTKMFTDAIDHEKVAIVSIDEALENMRFYDKYMIDAGLYTDNDELADERESNEIEIHHSLEVIITEYNYLNKENKAIVRSKLTDRDKEVIKNFYDEILVPVPKDFQ